MRSREGFRGPERSGGRITRRQAQMLELAAEGLTDKEIAARLGLAVPTIRSYWQRLYKENRIHNRAAAMAFWLRGVRAM